MKNFYQKYNLIINATIYFLISLFLVLVSLKTITLHKYLLYNSPIYIPLTIILIFAVLICAYHFFWKEKNIEKLFLMLVIPLGMIFMIYILPNYVPDENAHIYRAYDISRGILYTKKDSENKTLIDMPIDFRKYETNVDSYYSLLENINEKANYQETMNVNGTAASYFPILYIFSSIGLFLGRILNLNVLLTIYLARMFNFIFFIISGYFLIKKIEIGKLLLLTYLLSPMMLQQMTSLSADCVVNITCLTLIVTILNYKFNKRSIRNKEIILLLALITIISLAKYVYLPLILLLFLLDKKELKNNSNWKKLLLGIGIIIILTLGWMYITKYDVHTEYYLANNVNSKEQLISILKNPFDYINVLYNTTRIKTESYIFTFVGRNLGWLNIIGNNIFIVLYIYLLISSIFVEKQKFELSKKDKVITLGTLFICYNLVLLGMYLIWTGLHGSVIEGVQGRYFIPFLILLFINFINKNKYIHFKSIELVYCVLISLINFTSMLSIVRFFL